MDKTFDIRKYLDDKRELITLKGHRLNFSFRPSALDEMYKEYSLREAKVYESSQKYSKLYEEYTESMKDNSITDETLKGFKDRTTELTELTADTRSLGFNIVLVAAQANDNEQVTEEWINNELDPREFGFIIRYIMGIEDQLETKKKSKSK